MKPEINRIGNNLGFHWKEKQIHALVRNIRQHKDGRATAEIEFKLINATSSSHILQTYCNLLAIKTKKSLIEELNERYPLPEWREIVEQISVLALKKYREGEPVLELKPTGIIKKPEFLLQPFIYKEKINLFFGDAGVLKSYLAMVMQLVVQHNLTNNLDFLPQQANGLYLDYECDDEEMQRRIEYVNTFMEIPTDQPLLYRRCTIPFIEDFDKIEQIVFERNIKFLVIDSIGFAIGGTNLNESQAGTSFQATLRRLKLTSLILAHAPKDSPDGKKRTPTGTGFFVHMARNMWEIRKIQEEGENITNIAFFHKKNNQGGYSKPYGYRASFTDNNFFIEKIHIDDVPEFDTYLSLKSRIYKYLTANGSQMVKTIATNLGEKENVIRMTLNRCKNTFGKLENNTWGVIIDVE